MISPRTTQLVRAADLRSFRHAVADLATRGDPFAARDRLVVVPTRAAAEHLVRFIEDHMMETASALVLPDFVTRAELTERLFERLGQAAMPYVAAEREAMLTIACRSAAEAGFDPPFRVRSGLIAAMLDFFDTLLRHQKSVDDFERLTLSRLEAGAGADRGADRLIRQTRFFAAAFRNFERLSADAGGVDEHTMRAAVLSTPARNPVRHIVVAVRDRAGDPYGLHAAEWDLLARIPGLEQLDVVVTDTTLAGAWHERVHQWLPGIEEVRAEELDGASSPTLVLSRAGTRVHTARDREEEVAGFARWVKAAVRRGDLAIDRAALVVHQRLPYAYLGRTVLASAGVPCQLFDALPLAAEPYAAALDVLLSAVSANFSRGPSTALLRSPHLRFSGPEGSRLAARDVLALDRTLAEAGYLGDLEAFDRLLESWASQGTRAPEGARRAGWVLQSVGRELSALRSKATIAAHLQVLLGFLRAHDAAPQDPTVRDRLLRARAAVHGVLRALRDAYGRFDSREVEFDDVAAMVRRAIDAHTFAPRAGDSGVHLIDAESARFGEFDAVQVAGLVDGEWPDRPRRNIFYSQVILRDLGWPADGDRIDGARSAFADLVRLPTRELRVSTFSLEHDAIVAPSTFVEVVNVADIPTRVDETDGTRIFDHEALGLLPFRAESLPAPVRRWAERRDQRPADDRRGQTVAQPLSPYAVSSLERYQDCPFKFFAADVLKLEEPLEDEPSLSPRARGRFVHEVFQRFFEEWDRRTGGTITPARMDDAREVFREVAEPLLVRLPVSEASLERARLFGSPISVGMVDVVLGLEAGRPMEVSERWIERRLDGTYTLGTHDGALVSLKGVADRIDLLSGNRLRVIDYKSGSAPLPKRALQVQTYASCARDLLRRERGGEWTVDEASYVAFTGKRTLVQIVRPGKADDDVLIEARTRLFSLVGAIERGEFPPRPYEPRICSYCAYPSVCRKDYVGDE